MQWEDGPSCCRKHLRILHFYSNRELTRLESMCRNRECRRLQNNIRGDQSVVSNDQICWFSRHDNEHKCYQRLQHDWERAWNRNKVKPRGSKNRSTRDVPMLSEEKGFLLCWVHMRKKRQRKNTRQGAMDWPACCLYGCLSGWLAVSLSLDPEKRVDVSCSWSKNKNTKTRKAAPSNKAGRQTSTEKIIKRLCIWSTFQLKLLAEIDKCRNCEGSVREENT